MNPVQRFCLRAAGLSGILAVGFGAFGAHAVKQMVATLPSDQAMRILGWVDTGARYQLVHAAALVALISLAKRVPEKLLGWTARLFFWGSLIFSSSLYALALGAPLWMGAVTPIGGLMLLGGWACLIAAAGRWIPS
jgi:uncharacterized membrane protein YgdD (TMEM256/DUF423 family)